MSFINPQPCPQSCCDPGCIPCNDYDENWWGKSCDWVSNIPGLAALLVGRVLNFGPVNIPTPGYPLDLDSYGANYVMDSAEVTLPESINWTQVYGVSSGLTYRPYGPYKANGALTYACTLSGIKLALTSSSIGYNKPWFCGARYVNLRMGYTVSYTLLSCNIVYATHDNFTTYTTTDITKITHVMMERINGGNESAATWRAATSGSAVCAVINQTLFTGGLGRIAPCNIHAQLDSSRTFFPPFTSNGTPYWTGDIVVWPNGIEAGTGPPSNLQFQINPVVMGKDPNAPGPNLSTYGRTFYAGKVSNGSLPGLCEGAFAFSSGNPLVGNNSMNIQLQL